MNNFDLLGGYISEIDHLIENWIKRLGSNYNHFAVLYTLANTPEGECTQKQICEEWYLPKQTVSNICKDYREKGWIEFHDSPTDKRERILRLTDDGKAQAEPLWQATQTMCDNTFKTFGKQKTARLLALMAEFAQVCEKEIEKWEGINKAV